MLKKYRFDRVPEDLQDFFKDCWGFSIGEGWEPIVFELSRKIKELDKNKKVKVLQVKEKFGGLRYYMDFYSDEMNKLISAAEKECYDTCEHCGTKEDVTTESINNWVKTLCKKCNEERHERKR
jgi:hypothetical protein